MGSIDDVTWQVLTLVLTVVGLVTSGLLWRRRGPASGLRGLAFSLLPVAALLTGTWRLIWEIGDAIVSWAVRFVFSPVVWLGVCVAGASAALFVASSVMRRRGVGAQPRAARSAGKAPDAALPSSPGRPSASTSVDADLAEIEAILKKRGIS